eukprot:2916932-Alexandrium_andersonii.AAC.1
MANDSMPAARQQAKPGLKPGTSYRRCVALLACCSPAEPLWLHNGSRDTQRATEERKGTRH